LAIYQAFATSSVDLQEEQVANTTETADEETNKAVGKTMPKRKIVDVQTSVRYLRSKGTLFLF